MTATLVPALLATSLSLCLALAPSAHGAPSLADTLGFEVAASPDSSSPFAGWSAGPDSTIAVLTENVHGGLRAARIHRAPNASRDRSVLARKLPFWFKGDSLEFSVWLRSNRLERPAELWFRQYGSHGEVTSPTMSARSELVGSSGWTRCTLRARVAPWATGGRFAVHMVGGGTLDVDDAEFRVDGQSLDRATPKPAPQVEVTDSMLARVRCRTLEVSQVENLHLLARVWGFAKYRHPDVTAGRIAWDAALVEALPAVLAAPTRAAGRETIATWLRRFPVPDSLPVQAPAGRPVQLQSPKAWIHDHGALGEALASQLESIDAHRSIRESQRYVERARGGNATFTGEAPYPQAGCPPVGLRLLALFRLWNVVEYWYPFRDEIAADWDDALRRGIAEIVSSDSRDAYRLALARLLARTRDSHSLLGSASDVVPPRGGAMLPVALRHLGNQFVVFRALNHARAASCGLRTGDVLLALDGEPVDSAAAAAAPFQCASNEGSKWLNIAATLTQGPAGPCTVQIRRDGRDLEVRSRRDPIDSLEVGMGYAYASPRTGFRLLSPRVAYWNPTQTSRDSCLAHLERAAGTRCMVVDLRGHASDYSLATHVNAGGGPFAMETRCEFDDPGTFSWGRRDTLLTFAPRYAGKLVFVIDESTISAGEFMAMMLHHVPGALGVGSPTSGSVATATSLWLPGGEEAFLVTGGVFGPDGSRTHGAGIRPDRVARPTVAGIREGRDEVLESAVRLALGEQMRIPLE